MKTSSKVLAGLIGVCVGDALGVPVEFTNRIDRIKSPVTKMIGYGTYHQPAGTWSDDSSLTFCLADALCSGFSVDAIASSFCRWFNEGFWTPYGEVFDIGHTTHYAIKRLKQGVPPLEAGGKDERSNGNGSLMRILPLVYYHKTLDFPELIERSHQVSCITHAHLRSQIACGIYISIGVCLLKGLAPQAAYLQGIQDVKEIYSQSLYAQEKHHFQRVNSGELASLPIDSIRSGGYVIDTLEASLWCLLNSSSYAEAVLKAVNLGEDTDTTAAVTGGLAGIYYGVENIPDEWINQIARIEDIIDLATRLEAAIYR
ncbi:ADP-ribosylglycohydrolase family protein [Coleofasciculus sp. FACHB-1120]|uniref:ADP-ribosylglycohydrolase family protein n=1 Tax=Coleofasciculus sp. FACHB-1120 TaxID=2692783 RepID=UPI0016854E81|nr:ADP-ribosylglycohydrolase family protein [Coleofasciculus sp. FACHB-1120]MBD2741012.1 ADP-ribosylglycohydrolase family protein [Coleofasciculus sp. FACHB-1120]